MHHQSLIKKSVAIVSTSIALIVLISLVFLFPREASSAPPKWVTCKPVQVMVFTVSPRLHVRCESPVNGIRYFALSTEDAGRAGQVLSLLSTATVTGKSLTILYDPDDVSGVGIGCQKNDCRLIQAAGFGR